MIEKVLNTVRKNSLIGNGDSLVLGLSGGPDSVCLLHVLFSLIKDLNIKIAAVHINHSLRGEESDNDERYVIELCESLGVPLYIRVIDIKEMAKANKISLEEAGREARYNQFNLIADRIGATRIAVAHNRNDQVETVLMNIIRGTGLDGLKGMEYKRGRIIRPLLDIKREEIEEYCRTFSLNPRIDSSNLENIYTRNKIRLDLIPFINNLFETDVSDSIHRMSKVIQDDSSYMEDVTRNFYDKCVLQRSKNELSIDLNKLQEIHQALQKRIVRQAIKELKGDLKAIESVHIEDVADLIEKGRTGAELHLPRKIRVRKSYTSLIITYFIDKTCGFYGTYNIKLNIPGKVGVDKAGHYIDASLEKKDNINNYKNIPDNFLEQYFDYDKLSDGISLRNRMEGDIFKPIRSNGTKKLKEFLIDTKVPREIRSSLPLVAFKNEIVWIIGYKISDKFKVTENTKTVLKLKYTDSQN